LPQQSVRRGVQATSQPKQLSTAVMLRRRAPSVLLKKTNQPETTKLSTGRISKKIKRNDEIYQDDDSNGVGVICIDSSDDEDTRARKENKIRDNNEPGMQRLHQLLEQCTKNLFEKAKPEFNAWIQSVLHKPFVMPDTSYGGHSETFLQMRYKSRDPMPLHDPKLPNAVVLFTPPEYDEEFKRTHKDEILVHVVVDPVLGRVLRPHQIEGVQFMFDCLTGRKIENYFGCILADDMGLGKTLQCITLLWTLLRQNSEYKAGPIIQNVVIICPSSLVKNWYNEINKWLGSRLNALSIDSGQSSEAVDEKLAGFGRQQNSGRRRCANPVLIVSYETFRGHANVLDNIEVGLMICDEGHRLKNMESQTYVCLKKVNCKRRIIISGTPIQNDLLEYYSLVDFVNPGLLGNPAEFRKMYENPISKGRDADASDYQVQLGNERQKEMIANVDRCLIRRTADLLSKYLPPKVELVVCSKMEPAQQAIYEFFIKSKKIQRTLSGSQKGTGKGRGGQSTLQAITFLKKLCNHPQLVYEMCTRGEEIFDGLEEMFPAGFSKSIRNFEPLWSGKMKLLDTILANIKKTTDDRVVLISNYTQTIDLFQRLCDMRGYKWVRLDGTMTTKKRNKIVQSFNDPTTNEFIFLLSSKAGGCGLNLIGANRLIMFDPDWNPANDGQAMARVWRDGQRKQCFLYRFLATGTIEEKIFQRQTHKKALSNCIVDNAEDVERHFSIADLKELFRLEDDTVVSDTHSKFDCKRCVGNKQVEPPPKEADVASDLADWHHCYSPEAIPDDKLSESWERGNVSFVFYQRSCKVQS
jgi:DNA repair and recombination RAD54-like protein